MASDRLLGGFEHLLLLAILRLEDDAYGATVRLELMRCTDKDVAVGAIYTGLPGLLIGFIAQNPIGFAYTSPDRRPQNTFQLQPVIALHLWKEWYFRSAEANWTMGWHRHSPTMLPLSAGIGRTLVRPGLPPMSLFVTGQWMVYRQFAPVAPQTTINFGMTIAFPQFRYYWGH